MDPSPTLGYHDQHRITITRVSLVPCPPMGSLGSLHSSAQDDGNFDPLFLGFRVREVLLSLQGLWAAYGYLEGVQGLGVSTP